MPFLSKGWNPALKCSQTNTSSKAANAYSKSLVASSLYVDYIFLDTDERRRMAQNPHEYLIEQLQFTGDESVGSSSNKIKLNFNHPCKEVVFVVQKDALVDYCSSFLCDSLLYNILGAQPFNYTDCVDAVPSAQHAYSGPDSGVGSGAQGVNSVINGSDLFTDPGAEVLNELQASASAWPASQYDMKAGGLPDGHANPLSATTNSLVSDAGSFVLAETALGLHCWGKNPVVTAKLQLNGQDRFSEREGTYFDLVQPYQHHTRSPDTGINVYSFALRPEEHQPSGTCNFSRIDNATLQLVLSNDTVGGDDTAKVRVYATNYNVLRVMSGMGGLAYSN